MPGVGGASEHNIIQHSKHTYHRRQFDHLQSLVIYFKQVGLIQTLQGLASMAVTLAL